MENALCLCREFYNSGDWAGIFVTREKWERVRIEKMLRKN
jgi:hypothetical protein